MTYCECIAQGQKTEPELKNQHVYLVFHFNMTGKVSAVPLSTRRKQQQHIIDMVMKSTTIDNDFRIALAFHAEKFKADTILSSAHFAAFVQNFNSIKLNNSIPLGFDISWEDEPQLLL